MKRTIRSAATYILTAVLAVLLLFTATVGSTFVYADDSPSKTEYSDVLEDLHKDEKFSEDDYPEKADDYSLQVIQIAESVNNELFIYVYQPSGQREDLHASSINISTETGNNLRYYNYKLQLISADGVFYKYLVLNFVVSTSQVRYYSITSIYRPFDETIDDPADYDNKITEVNYSVSKQYAISTIDGKPHIEMIEEETIVVTDKFVGYARYMDGFDMHVGACDSHFVAFNTDLPMDKLLEADVYYTSQTCLLSTKYNGEQTTQFGNKEDNYAYLSYDQKVEHTGSGLFATTYKWDRIQTVDNFIEDINNASITIYSGAIINVSVGSEITEQSMAALKNKQWVLRFTETSYEKNIAPYVTNENFTSVGDVTILRLKFETDGVTYNLGVIDNKQTGSDDPINEWTPEVNVKIPWLTIAILGAVSVGGLIITRIIKSQTKKARKGN